MGVHVRERQRVGEGVGCWPGGCTSFKNAQGKRAAAVGIERQAQGGPGKGDAVAWVPGPARQPDELRGR
jgi:hypothetical protein